MIRVSMSRDDDRWRDGMPLLPRKFGRPPVWDATCLNMWAPSHLTGTQSNASVTLAALL